MEHNLLGGDLNLLKYILSEFSERDPKLSEISLHSNESELYNCLVGKSPTRELPETTVEARNYFSKIFKLFTEDSTKLADNLTKFILQRENQRLSSKILCIASSINDQDTLIKSSFIGKTMSWSAVREAGVPLWIKSEVRLRDIVENVAKWEYRQAKLSVSVADTVKSDAAESSCLYYYIVGKFNVFLDLLAMEPHNAKIKEVLERDHSEAKVRRKALEHAILLVGKKRYLLALTFFLLGGDLEVNR